MSTERDSRRYPVRPIVGVGAIIFQDDRVLLVERGNEPMKGFWSLPGGVLEIGEGLEDAVRREVREETGLAVRPLGVVAVFERIDKDAEDRAVYHYVLIDYLCAVTGGELAPADDASGAAWVAPEDLEGYRITPGSLPIIRQAIRERGNPRFSQ